MRWLIIALYIATIYPLIGQDFVTELHFEDSVGNRDTLIIGNVHGSINSYQKNILDVALSSLDVRFLRYRRATLKDPTFLFGDCDHQDGDISLCDTNLVSEIEFESKELFDDPVNCFATTVAGLRAEFFISKDAAFPITISWDIESFQDTCASNSFITEIPFGAGDTTWCEDQINYPIVKLKDTSALVLNQPNFMTLTRKDGNIVSSYYMFLSATNYDGTVIMNDVNNIYKEVASIYPNPVQNKLYINTEEQNLNYQILNIQGQQMMQGSYDRHIEVGSIPSGIYFLQLHQERDLYKAIKFVKE